MSDQVATGRTINWEPEPPYAFIQWKNTDVCADIHCRCGAQFHFDGWFMYAVKCGECGAVWAVEPFVRLVDPDKDTADPILLTDDEYLDQAEGK